MDLNLGKPTSQPPISRIVLHDNSGKTMFEFSYEKGVVVFESLKKDFTDKLVESKEYASLDNGVEAMGSFVTGAEGKKPLYLQLLTLFLPKSKGKFEKIHVTLESQLERVDLPHSLLLAAEAHSVLLPIIDDFKKTKKVDPTLYPLLKQFFERNYDHPVFDNRFESGFPIKLSDATLKTLAEDAIDAASLYFTTMTGAIIAQKPLKGEIKSIEMLNQLVENSLTTPGAMLSNGQLTFWYLYTEGIIGKINRTIATTLVTFKHAKGNQVAEQTQQNLAYKYIDLLDTVGHQEGGELQTNVGHIVCTVKFKETYHIQLDMMMNYGTQLMDPIRTYAQTILNDITTYSEFAPIIPVY